MQLQQIRWRCPICWARGSAFDVVKEIPDDVPDDWPGSRSPIAYAMQRAMDDALHHLKWTHSVSG